MQADLQQLQADQQELRGSLMADGFNFTITVRRVLALGRGESARLHDEDGGGNPSS
jgi:hypothetical protein